jgi:hypothetical protein
MKYSVGDKVLIRSDLEIGNVYGGMTWLEELQQETKGKTLAIAKVRESGNYNFEGCNYHYSEEMIERRIDMFTKDDLKVGYVTKNRMGEFEMVVNTQSGLGLVGGKYTGYLEPFGDDLLYDGKNGSKFDIMEVYGYADGLFNATDTNSSRRELLWQRKESPIEITIEEIAKWKGVESDRIRIKE